MSASSEIRVTATYFEKPGKENTQRTLDLARRRAEELGIKTIVVASTRGETGAKACEDFRGYDVVVVTHSTGFKEPNYQELTDENRAAIEAAGGKILTCQHTFGGVARAVRKKLRTYELEEIIAYTLRIFGEGMKVVVEIALMAADAGLVRTDEPVIAIAGTGKGADTAVVLKPANAQAFFDLQVLEILTYARILASKEVSPQVKRRLKKQFATLNPAKLRRDMLKLQNRLNSITSGVNYAFV